MILEKRKYKTLLKNVLQFEIIYKIMILFFFSPLLRWILKQYLQHSSVGIAFNQNIIQVFLSIPGIIVLLILSLSMMLLVYYNFYVVVQLITLEYQQRSYSLKEVVLKSFQSLQYIHKPSFILSGLYMILLLPLVHVGFLNNYIPRWDIPTFIFSELQLTLSGQCLIFLIYLLYYGLFIVTLFVPFYLFFERISFPSAVKKSYHLIKQINWKQKIYILLCIGLWVGVETAIMNVLPYPLLHNRDFNFYFIKYFIHFVSFRYSVFQYIMIYLISTVAMIFFIRYFVIMFCQYEKRIVTIQDMTIDTTRLRQFLSHFKQGSFTSIEKIKNTIFHHQWYQKYKKYIGIVGVVCLVIVSIIYLYQDSRIHYPWSIGHRGSGYAIENTYEAVKNADQCGADFAEIDIQLSQDGIPVVYHDHTMSRLSDSLAAVSDLTAQEFEDITLKDQQMTASPITLEHLIEKMQQEQMNIRLLIELKPTQDNYQQLVESMVEIINRYHFSNQAIFMSLHYDSVEYLHQLYPHWWIGYCIYGSIGDIDDSIWDMNIDFLAIEENRASTSLIQKATSQMLPIYVWTVNDTKKMRQYLEMGVSGLITNYPDLARQEIDEYMQKYPYAYYSKRILSSDRMRFEML